MDKIPPKWLSILAALLLANLAFASAAISGDTLIDFEGVADGTTVTSSVMASVTKGNAFSGWTTWASTPVAEGDANLNALSQGSTPYLKISSAASYSVNSQVTIGGNTYSLTGSRGMRATTSNNNIVQLAIPSPGYQLSVGFFFRFNGPQKNWSPRDVFGLRSDPTGNYQFLQIYDSPQPYFHAHWQPYSSGSGIGNNINFNSNQWYWVTMRHVAGGSSMQVSFYDPSNNYALVGTSTGAVSSGTQGCTTIQIGCIRYASTSTQSLDFDNIIISTSGTFPLGPPTATADITPPTISGVSATAASTSATITWMTNEVATGRVDYGTTTSYGLISTNSTLVTSHLQTILGLSPGTLYHYRVNSTDLAGNSASSRDYTFTTATTGTGNTYWVSPTGTATWANCRSASPLSGTSTCSLSTANTNAAGGDTVYLRAGTYSTKIQPSNSGSASNRITYAAYNNEQVTLTSQNAILLDSKSYISVDGIDVYLDPCTASGCYVRLNNGDYNIISNCVFNSSLSSGGWPTGVYIYNGATHNVFRGNSIGNAGNAAGGSDNGGTIRLGDGSGVDDGSGYSLFEGNTLYNGGHDIVSIYSSHNIFRNNLMYNYRWAPCSKSVGLCGNRNFILDGDLTYAAWNIIEDNTISFAGIPADANSGSGISLRSGNNIIRRNVVYNNSGAAFSIEQYAGNTVTTNNVQFNHIYNNVILNNGYSPIETNSPSKYGMLLYSYVSNNVINVIIKNNIFWNNNLGAMWFHSTSPRSSQVILNNLEQTADPMFVNDATVGPGNRVLPDLHLKSGSPAIDAGGFLTTTSSAGSGTIIAVADAGYFTDGYGLIGGDLIQLQGQTKLARITNINYNTKTLIVNTSLTWSAGQGVALPYDGNSPDIGAYEYVTTASNTHPADTDNNWMLSTGEVSIYNLCWKTPSCTPSPPTTYVSNANLMWKSRADGAYHYVGGSCPLCWVSGA